jgi:CDP-diacylglycerol pyrophosphatase
VSRLSRWVRCWRQAWPRTRGRGIFPTKAGIAVRHGSRSHRNARIALAFGIATYAILSLVPAWTLDRSALWNLVNDKCVPHFRASQNPAPCASIDLIDASKGTAIVKDAVGATHFLAIPTRQVEGIESPEVLDVDAPNWFARAWNARRFIYERLGKTLPRETVGLAINSQISRSQDQLHIHIDCVKPDVASVLVGARTEIGPDWMGPPLALLGKTFVGRRLDQPELDGINPFRLVASGPAALGRWKMSYATIVIVGASFADGTEGFVLLAGHADTAVADRGHGSDLLDRSCAIADNYR